jgi:hypothetical protein
MTDREETDTGMSERRQIEYPDRLRCFRRSPRLCNQQADSPHPLAAFLGIIAMPRIGSFHPLQPF